MLSNLRNAAALPRMILTLNFEMTDRRRRRRRRRRRLPKVVPRAAAG